MVTTQTQKYSFACVSSWNLPSYLLGPFAGRGRADQRVAPTGSGEDGATATSPERCKYECAVMRDVRCVPVCVHMGVRCTVNVQCVCVRAPGAQHVRLGRKLQLFSSCPGRSWAQHPVCGQ